MKACNEVANENYMNNSKPTDAIHIYKNYYKKIKNSLNNNEITIEEM